MYYTYILQGNKDKQFYTGYTNDLKERLKLHNEGKVASTKNRLPVELVYYETCLNQQDATHREKYLKTACGKLYIKVRLKNYLTGFRPLFVSDNPAYDWQFINYYFHLFLGKNPFGHSARRIGDFYAGLTSDFTNSSSWKKLRVTPHDHNPVNDAMGNLEAFEKILNGER